MLHDEKYEEIVSFDNQNSVWHYFVRGTGNANKNSRKCTKCCKVIQSNGGSTSGMHNHLKSIHSIILEKAKPSNSSMASTSSGSGMSGNLTNYFANKIDNSLPAVLGRLTACHGISFRTICESTDLRLGLTARGLTNIPKSVNGISNLIKQHGENIKDLIKNELQLLKKDNQKYSLTFDEWTSVRNRRYLNVNVHSKNSFWNLGLCRVKGSMPAKSCVEIIDEKLQQYGLCLNNDIVAITTDGASVMKRVGDIISADQHICLAHGIHLAVLEVLYKKPVYENEMSIDEPDTTNSEGEMDSDEENSDCKFQLEIDNERDETRNNTWQLKEDIGQIIHKIRKVVKHFKRSPTKNDIALQKHVKEQFQKEIVLMMDCKTRWNSLLLMLERFYKLKSCVQKALIDIKSDISFSRQEFATVSTIIDGLTPIKVTVESLCSQNQDLYRADIALQFMLDELSKQNNSFSTDLKTALLKRIAERRFKYADLFRYLTAPTAEINTNNYNIFIKPPQNNLVLQIYALLQRFNINEGNIIEEPENENLSIDSDENENESGDILLTFKEKLDRQMLKKTNQNYKLQNPAKISKKDLLSIVRAEIKYYEVEKMKGKYLNIVHGYLETIRPTSIESERSFSSASHLVTKVRSSLSDQSINHLCLIRAIYNNKK